MLAWVTFAAVSTDGAYADWVLGPEVRANVPDLDATGRDADGFLYLDIETLGDPARKTLIEDKFAAPIAHALNPGVPFGFGYLLRDLDQDGFEEVVVAMRMDLGPVPVMGAPTYIYRFDGTKWSRILEGFSMGVGFRSTQAGAEDIRFLQPSPATPQTYVFNGQNYGPAVAAIEPR